MIMGPQVVPVLSDTRVPKEADVVIVGGGIIGVSTALYLAERGLKVVLAEKGHIGGEQSSRNWGWCRQAVRDPRENELAREALQLWPGIEERTGGACGFKITGILFSAAENGDEAYFERCIAEGRAVGIDQRMLTPAEVAELVPGGATPTRPALYSPNDGRAEPQKAAPAIAEAARRAGATILTDCAVRGIELGGGKVIAAVTERGRITTSNVVVAGGAWTRRILADLGIDIPQLKVRSSVMRTSPVEAAPEPAFWGGNYAFRRRFDGGYTVAGGMASIAYVVPDSFRFFFQYLPALKADYANLKMRFGSRFFTEWREAAARPYDRISVYEETRVLDPAPDIPYLRGALKRLQIHYPAFNDARMVQAWAGFIDVMPDAIPIISGVDAISGLVVATGFSGHGFGIGPGAGHLIADMVTGVTPIVDPKEFRLSRFFDGSPIRYVAGL
ncbi:MAG: FAD-binding oxidoreductase [Ancalomicrobiaceae bacterium]|nr:FAD-binding oxidoreductase [Ancalomicrobiaceae bacterium]